MARPGLEKNPKFRNLLRLLGEPRSHVRGYLDCLWDAAYENGNPVIGDAKLIEATADYPGEPGKLCAALLECGGTSQVGFIEPVDGESGRFQIHDLYDHAPEYVKRRMEREMEREAKGVTLKELRATAGRLGGSKRKQTADTCLANGSKRKQTAQLPLPLPLPLPKKKPPYPL